MKIDSSGDHLWVSAKQEDIWGSRQLEALLGQSSDMGIPSTASLGGPGDARMEAAGEQGWDAARGC